MVVVTVREGCWLIIFQYRLLQLSTDCLCDYSSVPWSIPLVSPLLGPPCRPLHATFNTKVVSPTYFNLGPWMAGGDTSDNLRHFARFCKCILGHTPIGEYRERFFNQEGTDVRCACDVAFKSWHHLLSRCVRLKHTVGTHSRGAMPKQVAEVSNFLKENPEVFAFRTLPPSLGIR